MIIKNYFYDSFKQLLGLALICWALLPNFSVAQDHQDWSYNLAVYEVNVRQYSEEGTFAAFESHLDRLQEMGVGILWLMPVHPIGRQNRLGSLGSYYSVRDYLDINPEFGSMDDFKSLVQEIHDRDMYVIIDWVANHTSWDNMLTTEHPEWYSTDDNGNFIPPPRTNWSDVIELDYSKQGLRDYMIDAMKFWVQETGIDGFRFDAVSFVPLDFWQEASRELKAVKPDIFLLAEGDGLMWHNAGLDMTYGWGLYGFEDGILKQIADGTNTAANLNGYAAGEKVIYFNKYRMYFTSNHDENSWHGTPAELFGEAAEVFAVLTATFNGMPLIYSGQEAGLNKRLLFFDKDQINWREHENSELYKTLLHLKKQNRALWNGENGGLLQRVLTSDNDNIFVFTREKEQDKVLVALNLSEQEKNVILSGTSFTGTYRNVFSGDTLTLEEGENLSLPAWGYIVCEAITTSTGMYEDKLPSDFILEQNYPNPFNPATKISFTLADPGRVRLQIFDVRGRLIETLLDASGTIGRHSITWHAAGAPGGVYYYRLQKGRYSVVKKMILLR